jgi:hypothetical protein
MEKLTRQKLGTLNFAHNGNEASQNRWRIQL